MKLLIIAISLLLISKSHGQQIAVSELEGLKKKPFDDFESIVLKKNFVLKDFHTDSSSEQVVFVHPPTNAMIIWNKVWNKSHTLYFTGVDYLFFELKVYLSFKEQLKILGYKFSENETKDGQLCGIYTKIQPTKGRTSNTFTLINFCQGNIGDKTAYTIRFAL